MGQMEEWAAWWSGDTDKLREAHSDQKKKKRFWNRVNNASSRPSRSDLHIPVAADLAATSADLIYGTPPKIESDHGVGAETSARIAEYMEDGILVQLLNGAEAGSALGGRYHQVIIDQSLSLMPFTQVVQADHAIPEFRWGRLVAVTLWSVLESDNAKVIRHVERHELTSNGLGVTFHGVYEGNGSNLGRNIGTQAHPATAALQVGSNGTLTTPVTPGLNVVYIPNLTPQRRWRTDPIGRNLGRSDLDGLEAMMDALDEVYSSWMRDIRLGKARVFADRTMLEAPVISTPGGQPSGPMDTFDLDKELFVPVNGMPGREGTGKLLDAQQFNIRVAEHADTVNSLMRRIIRAARWSTATFDDTSTANMTATEVRARQDTTVKTRDRKVRLEQVGLLSLVRKMLTLDSAVFNTQGLVADNVTIKFPELIQSTTSEVAQTVQQLRAAGVLSLQTAVAMAHPDWDAPQIEGEVKLLQAEQPLTDPAQWRPDFGDDDEQEPPEAE
jgi:hypothetical protein